MSLNELTSVSFEILQGFYLLDIVLKFYVLIAYIVYGEKIQKKLVLGGLTFIESVWFILLIETKVGIVEQAFDLPSYAMFSESSISIHVFLLIMMFYLDAELLVHIYRWEHTKITNISVKEAIDKLPQGLLFLNEIGQTILINDTMRKLVYQLTGNSGYDAEHFVDDLKNGEIRSGCRLIMASEPLLVMMEDQSVWEFDTIAMGLNVLQVVAVDVSEQYRLNEEIDHENALLEQMKLRMKHYGENVDSNVKKEELLSAKISIHDNLGRILIATRAKLEGSLTDLDEDEMERMWMETLHMLKEGQENADWSRNISGEAEAGKNPVPAKKPKGNISGIEQAASFIGLKLHVNGELPDDMASMHLIHCGARECMTNAAHAGATEFFIDVTRRNGFVNVRYTDNGILSESETEKLIAEQQGGKKSIREGGGLSSLRQQVEAAGAAMYIETEGHFALTIMMQDVE